MTPDPEWASQELAGAKSAYLRPDFLSYKREERTTTDFWLMIPSASVVSVRLSLLCLAIVTMQWALP